MKKCKYLILFVVPAYLIYSCTKLDSSAYHSIPADDYYKNKDEVISAVLRPYTHTNAWATSAGQIGWWRVSELAADQLAWPRKGIDGDDQGRWRFLHYHTWTSDGDLISTPWTLLWTGLGYCNSAIENIGTRDAASMGITEEEKKNYVAEMKLLHAFYYIRIMDLWGNVPWVTSIEQEHPTTIPRARIFDSIEAEIKANINLVPNLSEQLLGRMSKAGAYAMLVELYLNAEQWSGKARWQDCINACDSLIDNKAGGVVDNRLTLDSNLTETYLPNNKASQEQIFAIVYNHQSANWNAGFPSDFYHFNQKFIYGGTVTGNNGIVLIPGVYSTYDDQDKRKKEWFFIGPMWYYDPITKKDNADTTQPVMGYREYSGKQLVFVDDIRRYSELKPGQDSSSLPSDMTTGEENSGVRFNKYKLGAQDDPNYQSTSWMIYRLTWIYYAKAEALMRLNGGKATQEAVDLINACRKRDFDPKVWAAKQYTVNDFTMDSLLAERGREFIFEGYRREDIIRFGKFLTGTWWDHKPTNDKNKLLFPVPIAQLALNPNLKQNPGY
ncbi:starch-binding protein [Arachidicoccus ginsenosidimutans]|uniref:RagB/SusD family nutrient uptake outer membrane protein n=1 Tax=Arachidicoccus sp. BS20 TaxID=1850526 RepID=UPI0007F07628|nr:RagB/SusD family nutrient uptake outer membrane protein [Arachidicoccus sp. BS20]ANI90077.1 starch-binding protein [Arachidicoccus sp. BS20]